MLMPGHIVEPAPVLSPAAMHTPEVSVIIPAYNVAAYIGETLESVFEQTFTDFEVIVVNDGSPDTEQLEEAVQPYLDRVIYLKQENCGAGAARNAGLQVARGRLIAFLDADDIWLPNYLHEQIEFMNARECELVCADALLFCDDATEGRSYMGVLMNEAAAIDDVTFLQLVDARRSLITSGVVARRQSIIEIGFFDEGLRRGQDFDLWLRLALAGNRLSFQRQVLLKYRCRTDGLTGDAISSHRRELNIFDKIERAYPLSGAERRATESIIRNRRALLQFEIGKLYAARGDFAPARQAFAAAHGLRSGLKTRVALSLTWLAPAIMKAICARRT